MTLERAEVVDDAVDVEKNEGNVGSADAPMVSSRPN
jgi:hypothetical protein